MKTNFGIEILGINDLINARQSGTLNRYTQIILNRDAANEIAAHTGSAAMIAGKSLLIEVPMSGPDFDEETLDWLFSKTGIQGARMLAVLSDQDLEIGVVAGGGASQQNLSVWVQNRCAQLRASTGLRVIFEHRLSAATHAIAPTETYAFFAQAFANDPEIGFSVELDSLLQARVASELAVNQILTREFARRCSMVSVLSPFPQEKFYENLGLELSNYPREIWSLIADLVKVLNAASHAPLGAGFLLNVRRAVQSQDESSTDVVRWADLFLRGLSL